MVHLQWQFLQLKVEKLAQENANVVFFYVTKEIDNY